MRTPVLFLVLSIGLAAASDGPAFAAVSRGAAAGEAPAPKKPPMRGPEAARPIRRTAAPKPLAQPALLPVASAAPADPGQCRLDCAHRYYFCLASDDADSCSDSWTSCHAGCSRPAASP